MRGRETGLGTAIDRSVLEAMVLNICEEVKELVVAIGVYGIGGCTTGKLTGRRPNQINNGERRDFYRERVIMEVKKTGAEFLVPFIVSDCFHWHFVPFKGSQRTWSTEASSVCVNTRK